MQMNDELDFGPPPMSNPEITRLNGEINELKVLIDTLQTNLRSAESIIKKYEPDCQLFNTPSYIWCVTWKDE